MSQKTTIKGQGTARLEFGKTMELRGAEWLINRYPTLNLLESNYRWKGGELDLIFEERCEDRAPELVFVEVRARSPGARVDGLSSVTFPKQMRLSRTIQHFLAKYRGPAKGVRVDLLAWNGRGWTHLPNVSIPSN